MERKKFSKDIESLKRQLGLSPDNQQLIINIAQIFTVLDDLTNAIHYYKLALDIQERYDVYFLIAECYEINCDFINAVKNYNESLRLNLSISDNDKSYQLKTYKRLLEIYKVLNNEDEIKKIIQRLENESQYRKFANNFKQNILDIITE